MRRDCCKPNSSWSDKFFASPWRSIQLCICTRLRISWERSVCAIGFSSQPCIATCRLTTTKKQRVMTNRLSCGFSRYRSLNWKSTTSWSENASLWWCTQQLIKIQMKNTMMLQPMCIKTGLPAWRCYQVYSYHLAAPTGQSLMQVIS